MQANKINLPLKKPTINNEDITFKPLRSIVFPVKYLYGWQMNNRWI